MKKRIVFILLLYTAGFLPAQSGLNISFGTIMTLSDNANLVLNEMDLEVEGGFGYSGTPTVLFSGSSDRGIYSDSDPEFYNLKISKSAGGFVSLNSDILIENDLNMDQGKLDLGGYTITLDGGQIIGEDGTNYITGTSGGKIEYIAILNNPDQENPGNLGIEITSVANLGQTVIRRGHVEQTSNSGGKSIHRYYDVNPMNNTGLNATFRIYYHDSELNGIPEGELEPWRSTDGGDTWELQDGSLLNTSNNWVQLSGVDAFSRWTLASASTSPLPLELSYFRGEVEDRFILLEWETISEENVNYFDIQRLENNEWMTIGRIGAAGFSTDLQAYSFQDFDYKNKEYYRLQILDFDGKEEYSEVILIEREVADSPGLEIFPVPAVNYFSIRLANTKKIQAASLFDATGLLILAVSDNFDSIDISKIPPGIYFLKVRTKGEDFIKKLVKQ